MTRQKQQKSSLLSQRTMDKLDVQKFQISLYSRAEFHGRGREAPGEDVDRAHLSFWNLSVFLGVLVGWWCDLAVILVVTKAVGSQQT